MKSFKFFLFLTLSILCAQKTYRETNPFVNDLLHTRLEVSFDWNSSRLTGKATLVLKPYFYPTRFCYLNARGMEIGSISGMVSVLKGNKTITQNLTLEYKYENDSLKIDLGKELTRDQTYTLVINYVSKPDEISIGGSSAIRSDKGLYFINPRGKNPYKMPQIWTQGETQSNSVWFPTIDSPHEKTTQEILITVDRKYLTLSNGKLVSSQNNPDGTRTDYWKMDIPHAPYLFMMAIGEFRKITDATWKGKEISYYVEKEFEKYAMEYFKNTREMIDFYSRLLDFDFPWPKYSQVVCRDYVSGAMENTSATLHGEMVIYCGKRELMERNKGEDVIAHELFHQWFGDVVTCESWSNLPLNESFATYGEYLWNEHKFGRDAADHHHLVSRKGYLAQTKEVPLIRYYYQQREEMFDAFSYNKGGQVLHMLRKAVGDEAFFKSLNVYLNGRKFQTAEIHDLRMAFEEVTGRDMNWFFNQWFMQPGHPELEIGHSYDPKEKKLVLTVEQKQDSTFPVYRLPLYVEYYIKGKPIRKFIEITEKKHTFFFSAEQKPDMVLFDAECQVLAEITHIKTVQELAYQLRHASLYLARREALEKLSDSLSRPDALEAFWIAFSDSFRVIRNLAMNYLPKVKDKYPDKVKNILVNIFLHDSYLPNRAEALDYLLEWYGGIEADMWCEKAWQNGSASLVNRVLKYYSTTNYEKAYSLAKSIADAEDSKSVLITIASVLAKKGDASDLEFFRKKFVYMSEFEMVTFLSQYINYSKKLKEPEAVKKVAEDLAIFSKEGGNFTRTGCIAGLKWLASQWKKTDQITSQYIQSLIP